MAKTITATFNGANQTRTEPIWRGDYGIVLNIEDVELPDSFEVHFSNDKTNRGNAKMILGDSSTIVIPSEYTSSGNPVYVYIFVVDGDSGYTEYRIEIPVEKRPSPTEEAPTAEEISVIDQAIAAINGAAADAVDAAEYVRESYEDAVAKAEEIIAMNAATDEMSQQALTTALNAENEMAEGLTTIQAFGERLDAADVAAEDYVTDGYVENGVAYFTHDGNILFEITGIGGGGGGGGGGGNNAVITVNNTTGWLSKTISSGSDLSVSLNWSSIEDQLPTGPGTLQVTVNGSVRSTRAVQQGAVVVDIGGFLMTGMNNVRAKVSDVYGNARTINFSVNVVALSITSTFDASVAHSGIIQFSYTPVGAVSKTVHFILDGTQIGTQTTSVSGRQMTYTIPAQTHGSHTLRVYFDATINEETVRSNELYYDIIYVEDGNRNVIIASPYNVTTAEQYTSLVIPFTVYNPQSITSDITISVNGTVVSSQTVDRSEQTYTYRADESGNLDIVIASGRTQKTISLTITELEIDVEAETQDLVLYLSSQGRSNQEENPGEWKYNGISATLSNFNWTSDGWQSDEDGITVLRVSGDARVTIPYKIFETDFRGTGKTIEVEFATRNVLNYDAQILSCMSGGRGLSVTAQRASLKSEQSEIFTQYKEDEHVRISFVVEKRAENRLVYIYINGIASGVVQYPSDDDFSQLSPVNISIGSNLCTMDLYCIRVYDNDLTRFQIVNNWIADTQVGSQMMDRYEHNNVYDEYGNIVIEKLPNDLPYMIITCPELPQYKGDKKTVSVSYTDPINASRSFTAEGAQADVQGTSSQFYARKNYKIKFKNGFVVNGVEADNYAMNATAVPTNTFTFKADVASSEGANNVELARLYNNACPYKTPAQMQNQNVRQGIDGFPMVIYWNNGSETVFIGKYNFNNDKGTEEVFGFVNGDESWETLNNTSERVIYKSANYSGSDWLNDFEARYPDTDPAYTDNAQLAEFAAWAVSTDTTAATGRTLTAPVTYDGVTYTSDTAAYRLAKFKAEAGNYMELDSAIFYYLFTELFLMVDSRAKNSFPSFIGTTI